MQILNIHVFRDFLNKNLKPEIIKVLTGERSFLLSDSQAAKYFKSYLREAKRNGSIKLENNVTISGKTEIIGIDTDKYFNDSFFAYTL